MWSEQYRYQIFTIFVLVYNECDASNVDFNEQIRDYSAVNDGNVTKYVKTLQKENTGISRYASFAPVKNAIRFKEVPDSVLSGSNHGRGLLHHDHAAGYGQYEYEDPHYSPGYEYQPNHHDPHDFHQYEFHDPHHYGGHHVGGYGHRHKQYDPHALAAKTFLWPIAGIALLGAAAALVSNPVLLQLGVVSGRKKRQIENLNLLKDSITKWSPKPDIPSYIRNNDLQSIPEFIVKKRFIKNDDAKVKSEEDEVGMEHKSKFKILTVLSRRYTDEDEERMIPVPLLFRNP